MQAATWRGSSPTGSPNESPNSTDQIKRQLLRGECRIVRSQREGIRVGVVGVGYWGSKHVRVLRSMTDVAAVVSIDQRFAGTANGRAGNLQDEYADIAAALPYIDAVVIATPPSSHVDVGLKAIAAGKHVLSVKPLATTVAAARSLVDAADAAGGRPGPGPPQRPRADDASSSARHTAPWTPSRPGRCSRR